MKLTMNSTLLTVIFRDPTVRSLAIMAAADAGEDGWIASTADDDSVNSKYPATINCVDTCDAIKTAYWMIEAFESAYSTKLEGHGLEVSFLGE